MKMCLIGTFCAAILNSCYVNVQDENKDHPQDSKKSEMELDRKGEGIGANKDEQKTIKASGYVVSAFAVTVDGVSYSDLEDFYTKESGRLPERMKASGYDDTYSFEFDAKVGFEDLWQNMTVYLLASGKTGYQAKTYINDQGGFQTFLPVSESSSDYKVRANKRISIKATKGTDKRIFCYNFSAVEKAAKFSNDNEPVILDTFISTITAYDCNLNEDSGIVIPEKP